MARSQVDPALLEGEDLTAWYLRTPDEIEGERRQAYQENYDEFFGRGGWQEARAEPPPPALRPPTLRAPSGPRVGPTTDGASQGPGTSGGQGFFGTYPAIPNPRLGPAYLTDLPSPLNYVVPRLDDWFELGDGTRVRGVDEVERIYGEQRRRISGQDLVEPPRARPVDRLRDGKIPLRSQLVAGQLESDPTCHPYGGWAPDPGYNSYSQRTKDYEFQVTGAEGVDYVVQLPGQTRGVKFDGCDVKTRTLQEAKGPRYDALLDYDFGPSIVDGMVEQAKRQAEVAQGRPVQWYFAEKRPMKRFKQAEPPVASRHVPAR